MSLATKRLSWALAFSLGLNLFLVAFGVMRWVERRDPRRERHERRAQVEAVLGAATPAMKEQRAKLAATRARVMTQLGADKFDAEASRAALEALRRDVTAAQELLHGQILERFPTLDAGARRGFAQRQFARPHREP
ncbi:MAG: periplasmic heavy metal sensor [Polyangiales bacterium]